MGTEQLNIVSQDFSPCIGNLCCCCSRSVLQQMFLKPKSTKRKGRRSGTCTSNPWFSVSYFQEESCCWESLGEALTRADPPHLQPDSGCHRSKWKHMLGKLFGNMPHSGKKERSHSWDFIRGKNIRQSTLKLALSS